MANMVLQIFGFSLGLLGFAGTIIATVIPHWRCSSFVGSNIITAIIYIKGLWMECVWQSTGIYQCEVYRSLLALPADLQAARALMVLSCITAALALVATVMGMKCTRFAQGLQVKSAVVLSGGIFFVCAGLLCLITVSWTTNDVVKDFFDPFLPSGLKYEICGAVYLGFVSAIVCIIGGVVLCWSSRSERTPRAPYPHRNPPSFPPPAFNTAYPPAPPYKPPEALKGNHAPSLYSASSSGYRLNNYV